MTPRSVVTTVSDILDDSWRYAKWMQVVSDVVVALDHLWYQAEGGERVFLVLTVKPPRLSDERQWETTIDFVEVEEAIA